jgi:hypothetical protein
MMLFVDEKEVGEGKKAAMLIAQSLRGEAQRWFLSDATAKGF